MEQRSPAPSPDRLVAALEECAALLDEQARMAEGAVASGGAMPRLRRPGMGAFFAAGPTTFGAPAGDGHAVQAMRDLATECRDVTREVLAGQAGKGWVLSLAGRVSQFLDVEPVEELARAAQGFFVRG